MNRLALAAVLALAPAAASAQVVRIVNDEARSEIHILIGPVDLPAGGAGQGHAAHQMVYPPVETVAYPVSGYLTGFRFDVSDRDGHPVPNQVVHHLNFIDPDHRELFLPISRRVAAAGGETGPQSMPWFLVGLPVRQGERLVVSSMLHNPTGTSYTGVTVRFTMTYVKSGRPWPLFAIHPFQVDAAFPFGDKSWDLPPGASSRSWDGKPAVPGRILIMGGHLHEYATRLRFEDVTANTVIFDATPHTDAQGNPNSLTTTSYLTRLGVVVDTSHVYRVTVSYRNPTPNTIPEGAMGVVGGIFLPAGGSEWPATDTGDFTYQMDRRHYLREVHGTYATILQDLADGGKKPAGPPQPAEHHHH